MEVGLCDVEESQFEALVAGGPLGVLTEEEPYCFQWGVAAKYCGLSS